MKIENKILLIISSWTFIFALLTGILLWTEYARQIDPYPYILLNLVLSCLTAVQTPIILMGQRKTEERQTKLLEDILTVLKEGHKND